MTENTIAAKKWKYKTVFPNFYCNFLSGPSPLVGMDQEELQQWLNGVVGGSTGVEAEERTKYTEVPVFSRRCDKESRAGEPDDAIGVRYVPK